MPDFILPWLEFLLQIIKDPSDLAQNIGLLGLCLIVFAETGLLIGFFLPGDSLLFGAGMYAATGNMDIALLVGCLTVAAIVGDAVGYTIGKQLGGRLYQRDDSFLFRKKHLAAAHKFYETHGGKTIILARFIPIVRTFAPTVAGAAQMPYKKFVTFNIVGAFLWVWGLCFSAYWLGKTVPNLNDHLHLILGAIIIISVLPIGIQLLKSWMTQNKQKKIQANNTQPMPRTRENTP